MLDNKLETFLAVAECRSFSKAGRKLFLSTVSVMKHVDALESEFGVRLFDRSPKGATLTPAGRSLHEDVLKITTEARAAIDRARSIAASQQEVIRVGSSIMRPCRVLLDLWTLIGEKVPYRVEVVPFEDDRVNPTDVGVFLATTADCFVSPYESDKCNVLELGSCSCMIAVPRSHHLAQKAILTWDDIEGEKLLVVRSGAGSASIDNLRNDLAHNHPGVKVIDVDRFYDISVLNMCASQNILAEIPSVWGSVHPALVPLPFDWDYRIPFGIVYAKNPNDRVQGFIDAVKNQLNSDAVASVLAEYGL